MKDKDVYWFRVSNFSKFKIVPNNAAGFTALLIVVLVSLVYIDRYLPNFDDPNNQFILYIPLFLLWIGFFVLVYIKGEK